MSVLVYIPTENGINKASLETLSYARMLNENVCVVTNGSASNDQLSALGEYGAANVWIDRAFSGTDAQQLVRLISKAADECGAETVLFSHDVIGKSVAPRLSARLKAGLVSGAVAVPDEHGQIKVNVFSGKAFGFVKVKTDRKIISLLANSVQPIKNGGACAVEDFDGQVGASVIKVLETRKPEGTIPLPEAERVVSAGRGLKGPENWGMVEELAEAIGAATACSRPVADIGWRPHHEHVGQTGVAIRPNLYIAIGISGAIQHLAGVNGSKVMVVINTDPEAPFFKAADYGIVGDAFEVVPKLTEAIKKFNASTH
jgi:electron transfer flavoprotein alpha subunit